MSRIHFMLSCVECEKSFITLGAWLTFLFDQILKLFPEFQEEYHLCVSETSKD